MSVELKLFDYLRAQAVAYASIPTSVARLLASLADAAETSVSLLRQLDERAAATNRVMQSFEQPLVRLAGAVDASLVDQTVDALGLLPNLVTRAASLTDRTEGMLSRLEGPIKALSPLSQMLDAGRLTGLVERLEEGIPGLVRLPDTEHEVRRLRETLDGMYRLIDEVQDRFGALPGAGLLLRRGDRHESRELPPDEPQGQRRRRQSAELVEPSRATAKKPGAPRKSGASQSSTDRQRRQVARGRTAPVRPARNDKGV